MYDHRDTIFALSSGQPPAAIAVVRISGPRAGVALERLIGRVPKPRVAALARIRDQTHGEIIDEALVLWFPAPHSETGEDVAELQLHGGRAVIAATLAALGGIDGLRLAEGGEFTRRAFENGKIDLTRVEGLADLIAAETEAQRRQAYGQVRGRLSERAEEWRARLTRALALVDAGIDFSDEADVPSDVADPARKIVADLAADMELVLADARRGERVRDGLVVAITGRPNVGKSTLLNRLARREAAIVSPYAGTTRDVIEVHLDLDGYAVTLLDTAGIRASDDPVEQEGIRRAQERAKAADLALWLTDSDNEDQFSISERGDISVWMIRTKIDIIPVKNEQKEYKFIVSSKNDIGIQHLIGALSEFARGHMGYVEPSLVTRHRQRAELERGLAGLNRALGAEPEEIVAEELRGAATALGRLTGRIDVEDVLDVIFRDFCIGK